MTHSNPNKSKKHLIEILLLAYSGELAAAYAYQGHAKSVRDREEKAHIKSIEEDEWNHRRQVGNMLFALGVPPDRKRETRATIVGRTLSYLCGFSGWLAPMYGAGRLESRNIREYEDAARHARDAGFPQFIEALLEMAEVEWDHEKYFRSQVIKHSLGRYLPIWPAPPPKQTIRTSFEADSKIRLHYEVTH